MTFGSAFRGETKCGVLALGERMLMSFALVLETPSHPAAAGGKLLHHEQNARSNVAGPASGLRGAAGFPYSRKSR
jgi:hypothetical protein